MWTALLLACSPLFAAVPTITSAANVDIYYNSEDPAEALFAYHITASDAPTAFDAIGLPSDATVDRATGWINGNRNHPGAYAISVRASNADGTGSATVRLAVHPTATGVRSVPGVFRPGQSLTFTVLYNSAVVVTGQPHLSLMLGPAAAPLFRDAVYASGSGTTELVFQYLVTAGDADPDGVQLLPSAPSGGAIADPNGLSASPYLPLRQFSSGITIVTDGGPLGGGESNASSSPAPGRLVNVSARTRVVEGDASHALITGFVVGGTQSRQILLRAIGPALGAFGITGALPDPALRLYSSSGALVAENDNWSGAESSAAASAVGAFSLSAGAKDAAVVVTLPPGAYTLMVAPNGGSGEALAEVYDATGADSSSAGIVNLSTRGQVDAGGQLIVGFAIEGGAARRVLVRGIGPGLAKFGAAGVLSDPTLKIYQDGRLVAENDDWSASASDVAGAAATSGAFALDASSKDAAAVVSLSPGSYTAVVSGAGGTSGNTLVEVYELPLND